MRRAKIVCTLGPASSSPEVLRKMVEAGMDVARLNFSHGTHEQHRQMYDLVRQISKDVGRPVAILQDLQGPKIRVGTFAEGSIHIETGDEFIISTADDVVGDQHRVGTTYPTLAEDVVPGDIMLVDDGLLAFRVVSVDGDEIYTVCEVGGVLKNNKGINLPTAAVSAPSLTEKDKIDFAFGVELGVDYVALSFVRSALDIHQLRAMTPHKDLKIISKIEKPQAVEALDEIIAVSDGIMIARGDLGVELPPQEVPVIQKSAIADANALGRLSITATQMLDSMQENPRPTRAEASDVANAVLDGTDALMLSGETASGKYPIESVKMMASIIEEIEGSAVYKRIEPPPFIRSLKTFPNAIAKAASISAQELDVCAIVVLTLGGSTARLMMTYRPTKPIIALTTDPTLVRQMALYWGVSSHLIELDSSVAALDQREGLEHEITQATEGILGQVDQLMIQHHGAKLGDEIIFVMGFPIARGQEANLMKFHRIGE